MPAAATAVPGSQELLQMEAASGMGAGWGRRRRGATWDKAKKKILKKKSAPKPKPAATKVVKKAVPKKPKKKMNAIDESKVKADKAINMAREKGVKARKK